MLRRWQTDKIEWWTLRDEDLLDRANPPISSSKDEWAEAIMDLSKLVVEGFEVRSLRARLDALGEAFGKGDGSITLLEKIVAFRNPASGPIKLQGLRTVQHIRSKVKGHSGSSEGKAIAQDAIIKHGSYNEHFKHVCKLTIRDLEEIESALAT